MTLAELTAKMKEGASKKSSFGNTVKFATDQGVVYIDGNQNPPAVSNDDGAADCTIKMDFGDFSDLIAGNLDGMTAFMTGKLKIEGDMGVAMEAAKHLAVSAARLALAPPPDPQLLPQCPVAARRRRRQPALRRAVHRLDRPARAGRTGARLLHPERCGRRAPPAGRPARPISTASGSPAPRSMSINSTSRPCVSRSSLPAPSGRLA